MLSYNELKMNRRTQHLIKPTVTQKGIVRAWEEDIMLPTYEAGEPEKNPIFSEKRVYQGSSGVVYPYPVIEKISEEKKDKKYKALFIENEYIKLMILPELGGRIQMAYDKVKNRHFVYYNQVIKPALVGLVGPWISGGIEFNWPQHHRPSTYMPTDYSIEKNKDGSITVWCNEVERMFRMKAMQGFTLHPGKSYIEIKVQVYNRTVFPQTFLWWANPAVVVNDDYYSVFPPDVHAVFDHGKREVSNFPISTSEYYKYDYSEGIDISKYKNVPVPTSYMAIKSKFDFVGGYEGGNINGGLLHVANNNISPGKKQWTWGHGDFGQAWDRNLTDEDGPYIELMTGVYTDNQPDFTWLQPGEEKSWSQFFMPYAEVGYVKNANKDAIVNVDIEDEKATIILYTTSEFKDLRVVLKDVKGKIFIDEKVNTSPEEIYKKTTEIGKQLPEDIIFELYTKDGKELLRYQADKPEIVPTPDPAKAAKDPKDIASIEQLFLAGHHLEQYRHATYNPIDYYQEALSREPGDIRCNNAMGLILLRKGKYEEAEQYFRTAIETQIERNPNPYDGEPHYNLGLSLFYQGKKEDAYKAFYKATWNAAWQDSGYFALAQIDASKGLWEDALDRIDRCLIRNWHNHKARQLKVSILRHLGRKEDALTLIEASLDIDLFNMGCRFEKYLLSGDNQVLTELVALMRGAVHPVIEYSLDYAAAGMYKEAIEFLQTTLTDGDKMYPMVYYATGYFYRQMKDGKSALDYYKKAAAMPPEKCFPNRIEELLILKDAMAKNPNDSFAPYYLGNFWYGARQHKDAAAYWEKSIELNDKYPTALRNLALAYYNRLDRQSEATALLTRAFDLDKTDSRILMELDQLYKKQGKDHKERLDFLGKHIDLVRQRDDMVIEYITLINQLGRYEEAMKLIGEYKFHPWEGGEGKITKQYTVCRIELAKKAIAKKDFDYAIKLLHELDEYPHNLGEGKLAVAEENDIDYYKGVAYRGVGNEAKANEFFVKATMGSKEPKQAFFYNDQQPDKIYFQGLAWAALRDRTKANGRFHALIDHGKHYLFQKSRIDYFAVSLPDLAIWEEDLNVRNLIHCYYVMGLGYHGLGDLEKAKEYLKKVQLLDVNHQDSKIVLDSIT